MKRSSLGGSDPLLDVYSREFRSMMEGVDEEEFGGGGGNMAAEKKRRLGVHQVKALEKYFDMENKLEPDRKVKLAQELGLQPRQVAIWFQNRRARWKTKQLERDYGVLKSNYDSLKLTCDTLQHDNQTLLKQIRELKEKVNNGERKVTVKEEAVESFSDEKSKPTAAAVSPENETGLNFAGHFHGGGNASIFSEFKDWSSDSDSSAILNEDNNNSPNAAAAVSPSAAAFLTAPDTAHQFSEIPRNILGDSYDSQFVKIEEHNFFGGCEEPCTILLSEQQAPAFHWGCPEDWNWEDE